MDGMVWYDMGGERGDGSGGSDGADGMGNCVRRLS